MSGDSGKRADKKIGRGYGPLITNDEVFRFVITVDNVTFGIIEDGTAAGRPYASGEWGGSKSAEINWVRASAAYFEQLAEKLRLYATAVEAPK
jgi:hypothetical protein